MNFLRCGIAFLYMSENIFNPRGQHAKVFKEVSWCLQYLINSSKGYARVYYTISPTFLQILNFLAKSKAKN